MKNNILLIMFLALFQTSGAQSRLGLEQYYYFGKSDDVSLVTIAYYQNMHNWYGEVRYNYEERKTMSIYAGKTFYREGSIAYIATPIVGLLLGQYKGGSLGANLDMACENIELSTQIQYIFSTNDPSKNFILNWTELSYQVLSFIKSGFALQQSTVARSALKLEAGCFVGFSYKNWELPLYIFSPLSKERNYVIGINWEWQHNPSNKNHNLLPSLKGRRNLALD